MFVLQKKILFARGLNWDQSCLWKTPPSHFLLFSPLACPYFLNFFSSPDFWGVKEAPCKNLYVFGENSQRNQFPKLTTFLLHFSLMSPLCHSAVVYTKKSHICVLFHDKLSGKNPHQKLIKHLHGHVDGASLKEDIVKNRPCCLAITCTCSSKGQVISWYEHWNLWVWVILRCWGNSSILEGRFSKWF